MLGRRYPLREISVLMKIPKRSLQRKMSFLGISVKNQYSDISDENLEALVLQIHNENPLIGERFMLHRLGAMGYMVQRARVRRAIHAVIGPRHLAPAIVRRRYSVRAPLSVVHVDGYHKLIK